jgi:hypothetical protein
VDREAAGEDRPDRHLPRPPRWLFCRVETDDGLVGWGEPVVEARAEVVRSAFDVLAEYLIGEDPLRIEYHWQVLTKGGFYRGGPVLSSAVAGLDQARRTPEPAAGEAVVDVERVGVRGADAEAFSGQMAYLHGGDAAYPMRIGQAWCGVVCAVDRS